MPAIQQDVQFTTTELFFNPTESKPLSHGFHLSEETAGQSESKSQQLTENWRKQENTEPSDTEDDIKLHQLMKDIRRYIRSIDISNL
jgi:hypothetical protein